MLNLTDRERLKKYRDIVRLIGVFMLIDNEYF